MTQVETKKKKSENKGKYLRFWDNFKLTSLIGVPEIERKRVK